MISPDRCDYVAGSARRAPCGRASAMPPTWLRLDSVQQTISHDVALCEVALADDTRAESIDLRVDDERLCLRCRDDSAAPVAICWSVPVVGSKAAARLLRSKRVLAVRAPLERPTVERTEPIDEGGEVPDDCRRFVRATVRAVGRGTLVLRIPALVAGCEIGQRAYVLASRRNHFASLVARNYDWCDTFSREASCDGASTIEVTLSCSAWVWEPSEVHVTIGSLGVGEMPPSIESGHTALGAAPSPPKPTASTASIPVTHSSPPHHLPASCPRPSPPPGPALLWPSAPRESLTCQTARDRLHLSHAPRQRAAAAPARRRRRGAARADADHRAGAARLGEGGEPHL